MNLIGDGNPDTLLSQDQIREIVAQGTAQMPAGKRILAVIPDHTRSCPLPLLARELHKNLTDKGCTLDYLIALGTHPAMTEEMIDTLVGAEPGTRLEVFPGSRFINHEWDNPAALSCVGQFTTEQVAGYLSADTQRFARDIDVTINSRVFDYDHVMILGPVFPHEVVGFSGGAKYFFPGICGPELLNFFHWLGALITIPKMIGVKNTPVRAMLHAALDMVEAKVDCSAMCMVVKGHDDLAGLYHGAVRDAWSAAVDLSDKTHIFYTDRAYDSVLSCAPKMYDELWTGGKCMYKLECVVADGGELIIYAPHIDEIAVAHGENILKIGYHSLPYFTNQWDKYKDIPWGVLAHSTHVRGIGTYENGVEKPRVKVTLATAIPPEVCEKISLGYRDPASINPEDWANKEAEGKLLVPKAGEMLYRLQPELAPEWQKC